MLAGRHERVSEANPFNNGGSLSGLSIDDIFNEMGAGERCVKRFSEACFWSF